MERGESAYRVHFGQLAQDVPHKVCNNYFVSEFRFGFCGHSRATPTAISVSATSHPCVSVCGETFEATVPETNTHITVTRLARDVDDVTRHSNNVKLWFLHGMQMETRRWRNRSGANKNSV